MSIKAMRQAIDALLQTDTHPISSAEQYFKEIEAMEALKDAIDDAIEQAEKQQPVAWTNKENLLDLKSGVCSHMYAKKEDDDDLPLYTAPPQREWVGLTEDEAAQCWDASAVETWKNIEAKLWQKNFHGSQSINNPSEWID